MLVEFALSAWFIELDSIPVHSTGLEGKGDVLLKTNPKCQGD